jgi:hypothetical protein
MCSSAVAALALAAARAAARALSVPATVEGRGGGERSGRRGHAQSAERRGPREEGEVGAAGRTTGGSRDDSSMSL